MRPSLAARAHDDRSDIHRTITDRDMLTMTEVPALVRELSTTNVLSVYLDTHAADSAMRDGPVIAPYLRARQCAVIDAIVPSTRRENESAQRWERER
jgi:hypothetical protein